MSDKIYLNAFNLIDGFGPVSFKKILAYFPSAETAWRADQNELRQAGLEKSVMEQIRIRRSLIDPEKEFEKLARENIRLLALQDKEYPKMLREIYASPAVLYLKGRFETNDEFSLAIVGSRLASAYGQQIAPALAADLAQAGLTIVSGMAKGIDTLAHQAALKAGGRTIAVLGSGLDRVSVYPRCNQKLAEEISENGAVISEFPVGSQPLAKHFPQRNRIVSGLSLGVLVIEANQKSGSLITANCALEQNRDVFAIPGPVFSQASSGTNNLIKLGAKLVTEANDILQELNLTLIANFKENRKILPDGPEEASILEILTNEPIHIDKIINHTKLSTATVNSTLSLMELKGKAKHIGGGSYVVGQ